MSEKKEQDVKKGVAAKTAAKPVATSAKKPAATKPATTKPAAAKPAVKKEKKPAIKKDLVTDGSVRGRLKARYISSVVPSLMEEQGYKNVNEVPKLHKVVLNMRLGDIKDNAKSVQLAQKELDLISGQKSVIVKAKKSVANFKLRENQPIGIKVTLRGDRMYEFFDKLVSVALPRVRDFRGISSKSFDGRGNYSVGIKEQITFPEISYETIEKIRGFDVSVVTTAKTDKEARELLTKLGMPFRKERKNG